MKLKEKLLNSIRGYSEDDVNKILLDFGFRWFVFGLGFGIVITCLIFAYK